MHRISKFNCDLVNEKIFKKECPCKNEFTQISTIEVGSFANGTIQRCVVMRIFAFEQNLIEREDQRAVMGWKRSLGRSWGTVYKSGREVSCILEKRLREDRLGNRIEKLCVRSIYWSISRRTFFQGYILIYSSRRHRKNLLDRFEIYAVFIFVMLLIPCRRVEMQQWCSIVKSFPIEHQSFP